MTLFREHRGSYEDSIKTIVEVNTLRAVEAHMAEINKYMPPQPSQYFWTSYYGIDGRCNWLSWIVLSEQGVVGFSDGELK